MGNPRKNRPITDRRLQRMAAILARRQPDVAVVIEDVHDPHNVSAVLRSCDATGVAGAHLVYRIEEPPKLSTGVAAGAQRWLDVHWHDNIPDCYAALRRSGMTVYATYLGENTLDLHHVDLTQPCAFVFGNEARGLSSEAVEQADATLKIPMMGMVDSLNISVAAAVTLYEMLRQRREKGMYDRPGWSDEEMRHRLSAWLERERRDPGYADEVDFSSAATRLPAPRNRTGR